MNRDRRTRHRWRDTTTGPVGGHLMRMTLPMVAGLLAVLSISVADTYFIGHLGVEELAALSFTFPEVFSLIGISIGLGEGANSVVSRAIGARRESQVRRLATDSLLLAAVIVGGISILGLLTIGPLFRMLGARSAQMVHIEAYMQVWYPGVVLLAVSMVANNILRATGDALSPSALMVVTAAVHIVLDPILIFGLDPIPALGMEGAAWASVLAHTCRIAIIFFLLVRVRVLDLSLPPLGKLRVSWGRVMSVALPAAASNLVTPAGAGILTAIVARFGAEAVAGFGVATRIEFLSLVPILALSAGMAPVAGQNWGAGATGRIRLALLQSYVASALWAVLVAGVLWMFGPAAVQLFNPEPHIVGFAADYLDIVIISLSGYGVLVCSAAAFNAVGRAALGLALHISRTFVLAVPLAWLGAGLAGPTGVAFALAAANLAAAGLAVLQCRRTFVLPP